MSRIVRLFVTTAAVAAIAAAGLALVQPPALAGGDDCPTRPLPPALENACRACPTVVDPVVCTVVCKGGPREKTYSNQCFANCSGNIIRGECRRIGT